MAQQPPVGQGLPIIEASRSHSVVILWTRDQPDAETYTLQHKTLARYRQISMPTAGFEPTNPRRKWSQTHTLHRAATGIGYLYLYIH